MKSSDQAQQEWVEQLRDRLSNAMRSNGFSQRDLGKRVGVSGPAVAHWQADAPLTDWWRLRSVALALGVSADWLLGLPGGASLTGVSPEVVERAAREIERRADEGAKTAERARALAKQLRGATPRKR
jgi:transcriptional regulator with XRE-family HTH domain